MIRKAFVVLLILGALLATVSCKKKAGGPCTGAMQVCADKENALVCRGGALTNVVCAGPLACSKFQDHVNCDTSVASAGDPCMGEDDEFACSPDKKHALVCKSGRFETYLECRGPSGCAMTGRTPTCDTSLAESNDPCKKEDQLACADDLQHMLVCRNSHFTVHRYCRGQNGCKVQGEGAVCDESLSQAGDPCGIVGQVVCSTDGKTELICQAGVYMKSRSCKTSCTISTRVGRHVDCN